MNRLIDLVENLMASNTDMRARMDALTTNQPLALNSPSTMVEALTDSESSLLSLSSSTFEEDLSTSRPYRKLRPSDSSWSISSSEQVSMAISVFSDLTMDHVSNISVLRLPVWSRDLSNASDYYFGVDDAVPARLRMRRVAAQHYVTLDRDERAMDVRLEMGQKDKEATRVRRRAARPLSKQGIYMNYKKVW